MRLLIISLLIGLSFQKQVLGTPANYTEAANASEVSLVVFCSPEQEYCKELSAEWLKAIAHPTQNIGFIWVDCSTGTCDSNIRTYPTINVYYHGALLLAKYDGPRTLQNWLLLSDKILKPFIADSNSTSPKVYIISSSISKYEQLAYKFLGVEFVDTMKTDLVVLGDGAQEIKSMAIETGKFYSYVGKHICIGLSISAKCPSTTDIYSIPTSSGVLIVKPEEKRFIFLNITALDSESMLRQHVQPFIGDFTKDVADTMFIYERKGIVLYTSNDTSSLEIERSLRAAALKHTTEILLVAITDSESDLGGRMFGYLGLSRKDLPILIGISFDKMARKSTVHQFNKSDISVEGVNGFINEWLSGSMKRRYKSEEIPERQLAGPIRKVVSKNFMAEVVEKPYDVMVKFFSPGCGACIKFKPVYEKIAEEYRALNPGMIDFVEVNILQNEVEGHEIKYYPTIKYFAVGNKENPAVFSGRERTYEKMIEFMKESASKGVVHPKGQVKSDL